MEKKFVGYARHAHTHKAPRVKYSWRASYCARCIKLTGGKSLVPRDKQGQTMVTFTTTVCGLVKISILKKAKEVYSLTI